MQAPAHSPFLPLLILVACLCGWLGYQVYELNSDRFATEEEVRQAVPQAEASLTAKKRLLSLAQDILQTSQKDAAAAQIVSEFKIREQNPPAANAPAPTK